MKNNILENLLENLSETLDRMVLLYNEIFLTAQKKQEYIISGDIDKLESTIYQERNQAETILLLEEKRRYLLRSINQTIGSNNNSIKLSVLIEQLREPYKSKFKEQFDTIVEIVIKVEGINKTNTTLTKHSLEYINNLIKYICTESLNDNTYQQTGKLKEPELNRILFEINA
ncbi:adenosylmethionine-8-amino-7-oxononanoate aminotransferase [Candidatus Scalindua japonica]|uniref:Adenosylmethionine-8-amino-7-oxononanoate aminotransferase n=1 Tax=Candidatus Scalindua japonica TaxID=1284222 RepID=A0A286TV95_9BACT|nr:flagellar protein FlgN [Candidatus Scalindua japonica]GAX59812.1 adenosylmethionine-8-amino-7-oxononanoate aminotransferase [Candidatus Scalindua japonica]